MMHNVRRISLCNMGLQIAPLNPVKNIAKSAVDFKTSLTAFDGKRDLCIHVHIAAKPYKGGKVPKGDV